MPTARILDLLDQAQALGFTGRVGFHHYSEPLLDDRNITLAWEARNRGMLPYLHTNGDMLRRDRQLCREVERVYDHVVVGLYDYETPQELDEAKKEWRERLPTVRLDFSFIGRSGARTAPSLATPRALVPTDPRMAVPDLTFANGPCHRPLLRMIVQHDGEMGLCCEDVSAAFSLGNVYRDSIEALWYSDRHTRLVMELAAGGRDRHPLCRICPQPPTAPLASGKKLLMLPRRRRPNDPLDAIAS
jgi:hypothetical protein